MARYASTAAPAAKAAGQSSRLLRAVALLLLCAGAPAAPPDHAPQPSAPPAGAIVVQNYYYARSGKADEVYAWRIHASDVRVRLGLPRGRILRRVPDARSIGSASAMADVIWECDYPSLAARAAEVARLGASAEFAAVEKHMDTLIRDFRRAVFEGEVPVGAAH
jgi:hypothetical protein